MQQITTDHLRALLADHTPPCVSLYQPTHRWHPDNQQDPIRYRNLLAEMERSLNQKHSKQEAQPLLEKFQALAQDDTFWNHRTEGLAVCCSPEVFHIFELQRTVPEQLVVADSFHVKPLIRIVQSADRYQILALNRQEIKLYEGNRDELDEVDLAKEVPRTLEEALGTELTEPHRTVASYGGVGERHGARGVPSMHHGHGGRKDEVDTDEERFFRVIDRAILEHHSRPSGLPLVLAALPEYHALYHEVSHNPFLASQGIRQDPWAISVEQLRKEAWRINEPEYHERLAQYVDRFEEARSKHFGASDLSDVAQALIAGRVATLLVDADRQIPGKLDLESGRIEFGDQAHLDIDDLLDDFAELTLKSGGEVIIVPSERMPTESGIAATYRF